MLCAATFRNSYVKWRFRYVMLRFVVVPPVTLSSSTAKNQYRKLKKQIFPEKELCGHRPNFDIHVSVSDLYIPTIDLPWSVHLDQGVHNDLLA